MTRRIRILIVDDSASNRRTLQGILERFPEVEVVGKASDGEDALRQALTLRPDLVTLDLQMPRMDGFTFLRILMARMPLPVIVVSTYSQKENVFKTLELGALDFVAKPSDGDDLTAIRDELHAKVTLVRYLSPTGIRVPEAGAVAGPTVEPAPEPAPREAEAACLIAVGASTGGPAAIGELLERLPGDLNAAIVIAQHMPEKFTRTFAERLNRRSRYSVHEASDGDPVRRGVALVAPGRRCMEVVRDGDSVRVRVVMATSQDRYVPSVDRLFSSAARAFGKQVVAVVLTGMGDDGKEGVGEVSAQGGRILAEAPESAVIFGMPGASVRTGLVEKVLPLGRMPETIARMVREQEAAR